MKAWKDSVILTWLPEREERDGLPVPYAMMEQSLHYMVRRRQGRGARRIREKVIKKLELGFREGQWQYFTRLRKGMPFTPDAREVSVLTEAFKGCSWRPVQ